MIEIVFLGTLAVVATWDVFRRRTAANEAIEQVRQELGQAKQALSARVDVVETRVGNINDLIHASKAAQSTRLTPRIMGR